MHRNKDTICSLGLCVFVWSSGIGLAQDNMATGKAAKPPEGKTAVPLSPAANAGPTLSFQPPAPASPMRRDGTVARGISGDTRELALSIVAPEQTGWSSRDQPDLYWFTSRHIANAILLTVRQSNANAASPLFEGPISSSPEGGIQLISLQKLGIKLVPNIDYEWSLSLVINNKPPTREPVLSGRIRFAPFSFEGRIGMDLLPETEQAERLARGGYWYDVVQLLRKRFPATATEIGFYESAGLSGVARHLRSG